MLNECDKELERRGHRFVRYADDMLIFCQSRRAAERVLNSLIPFIEKKLLLRVNREKTQVTYAGRVKYLGDSFYLYKGKGRLRVHKKSTEKLKSKIKEITARSNGMSTDQRKKELNYLIKGWVNYFKLADMKTLLVELDEWTRSRIRRVTWKRWKRRIPNGTYGAVGGRLSN